MKTVEEIFSSTIGVLMEYKDITKQQRKEIKKAYLRGMMSALTMIDTLFDDDKLTEEKLDDIFAEVFKEMEKLHSKN